jgi:hypothetical protein
VIAELHIYTSPDFVICPLASPSGELSPSPVIGAIACPIGFIFVLVDLYSISRGIQIRRRRFSWFNIGDVIDYILENFFLC